MPVEGMSRDDDSDGLLVQTGVYDWHDGSGPRFNFSFVRQYIFEDEDGEYDHMEQLELLLTFEPTAELASLPREELWSFEKSLDQFFAEVEALPSYRGVIGSGLCPQGLSARLEEV